MKLSSPACGSGGMFVQSARFVENHQGNPSDEISVYGQEKVIENVNLCKMNLAVHGLSGDIKQGNTYYEDKHNCLNKFDYVMANPPFNANEVDKERIKDDPRFPFGMPRVDNANYIWIQQFYSALNENGRAGFVMASSAADAGGSEQEIRKKIIQDKVVDVIVSVSSNFFANVTLPCMLWFFDKGKHNTERKNKILFIDASEIYLQVDRAHRAWTNKQVEFLSDIVRMYREELTENVNLKEMEKYFPDGVYLDIPGLCKVATIDEIKEQGWSLNPGRYVGIKNLSEEDDFNFYKKLKELNEEYKALNQDAIELESIISKNINTLLGDSSHE